MDNLLSLSLDRVVMRLTTSSMMAVALADWW